MNANLLLGAMKAHGENIGDLAEAIGLTRQRLSAKIHGRASFTHPELATIRKRYNLSAAEIEEIFFADNVS